VAAGKTASPADALSRQSEHGRLQVEVPTAPKERTRLLAVDRRQPLVAGVLNGLAKHRDCEPPASRLVEIRHRRRVYHRARQPINLLARPAPQM